MKNDNEEEVSKSLLFDHTDRKEKVLFKFKAIHLISIQKFYFHIMFLK